MREHPGAWPEPCWRSRRGGSYGARSRALTGGQGGARCRRGVRPSAAVGSRDRWRKLAGSARLSEQSERRLLELMLRFLRYRRSGAAASSRSRDVTPEDVRGFVLAPSSGHRRAQPSVATSHLRRSAVRLLFRVLRQASVVDHDPTLDVVLPPRSSLAARPLTDDEIALGRSFSLKSLGETRQPAAWALAEATARTSELSAVRVARHRPGRRPGVARREHEDSSPVGSAERVGRRRRSSGASTTVGDRRTHRSSTKAPAAARVGRRRRARDLRDAAPCRARRRTRRASGLGRGVGRAQILEQTGQIEAVAAALGVRSLDRAARLIGWDWTTRRPRGR